MENLFKLDVWIPVYYIQELAGIRIVLVSGWSVR
jgi:hypothetical protein